MPNSSNSELEQKALPAPKNLEDWVGDYSYSVGLASRLYATYEITIRSEDGRYVADLAADGWQMGFREKVRIEGDHDSIKLILEEHLTPSAFGNLELGSTLLVFKKTGQDIHTEWTSLPSVYPDETQIPEITFVKEEMFPLWFYETGVENKLLYKSVSPDNRAAAYVYTSTNPTLGETYYLLTVLPTNEPFSLQPANAYAATKEFTLEWTSRDWEGWENINCLSVNAGLETLQDLKHHVFVRNVQLDYC